MEDKLLREKEHQEDLAKLRGLRPIDDDFMRCIFRENKPLAQLVLRILKGVEIVCVAFEQTRNEKAIRIAMNMIERGTYTLEEIAEVCELPLEKVQELAKQKGA